MLFLTKFLFVEDEFIFYSVSVSGGLYFVLFPRQESRHLFVDAIALHGRPLLKA